MTVKIIITRKVACDTCEQIIDNPPTGWEDAIKHYCSYGCMVADRATLNFPESVKRTIYMF